MNLAYTATVLFATAASGAALLRIFGLRYATDRLAFAGWSWLLGSLLTALLTLLWLVTLRPDFGATIPIAQLVFAGITFWRCKVGSPMPKRVESCGPERWLFTLAVLSLALLLLDGIAISTQFPILFGDEAEIWAAKARSLYAHGLGPEFVTDARMTVMHAFYPLLGPLLEVDVSATAGHLLLFAPRLPIQGFSLALLAILASSLRRVLRPGLAAAILILVFSHSTLQNVVGRGKMDLVTAAGILAMIDAWDRWRADRHPAFWRIGCAALAITLWSKNEGSLLGIALAAALITQPLRRQHLLPSGRERLWLALPLGIYGLQILLNFVWGFDSDLFEQSVGSDAGFFGRLLGATPERGMAILDFYWHHVLATSNGRFILLAAIVLMLLHPKIALRSPAGIPLTVMVLALAGHVIVFLSTPHELSWHLETAALRISFQLVPIAALGLAGMLAALSLPRPANGTHPGAHSGHSHPDRTSP